MPNHITNILTVSGDEERVKNLFSSVNSKKSIFDFNKIIPMPESLNITSGSSVDMAIIVLTNDVEELNKMMSWQWVKEMNVNNEEELRRKLLNKLSPEELQQVNVALDNITKYGHKDWYSWSVANWGTKWNAYDLNRVSSDTISFDTAWSTPFPVIMSLSEQFPDLRFEVKFADEDLGSNCGVYVLENGVLVKDHLPKGWEALKFALSVKGEIDDEYLYSNMIYYIVRNEKLNDVALVKEIENNLSDNSKVDKFLNLLFNNCEDQMIVYKVAENLKTISLNNEFYEVIGVIDRISQRVVSDLSR